MSINTLASHRWMAGANYQTRMKTTSIRINPAQSIQFLFIAFEYLV